MFATKMLKKTIKKKPFWVVCKMMTNNVASLLVCCDYLRRCSRIPTGSTKVLYHSCSQAIISSGLYETCWDGLSKVNW